MKFAQLDVFQIVMTNIYYTLIDREKFLFLSQSNNRTILSRVKASLTVNHDIRYQRMFENIKDELRDKYPDEFENFTDKNFEYFIRTYGEM